MHACAADLICCICSRLLPQTTHGCGDLIFSSHTTFMLVGMLTYNEYGTLAPIKVNHIVDFVCVTSTLQHH